MVITRSLHKISFLNFSWEFSFILFMLCPNNLFMLLPACFLRRWRSAAWEDICFNWDGMVFCNRRKFRCQLWCICYAGYSFLNTHSFEHSWVIELTWARFYFWLQLDRVGFCATKGSLTDKSVYAYQHNSLSLLYNYNILFVIIIRNNFCFD